MSSEHSVAASTSALDSGAASMISGVVKKFDSMFSSPSGRRRPSATSVVLAAAAGDCPDVVVDTATATSHAVLNNHGTVLLHVAPHHHVVDSGA